MDGAVASRVVSPTCLSRWPTVSVGLSDYLLSHIRRTQVRPIDRLLSRSGGKTQAVRHPKLFSIISRCDPQTMARRKATKLMLMMMLFVLDCLLRKKSERKIICFAAKASHYDEGRLSDFLAQKKASRLKCIAIRKSAN
jgi:hypothetical protein